MIWSNFRPEDDGRHVLCFVMSLFVCLFVCLGPVRVRTAAAVLPVVLGWKLNVLRGQIIVFLFCRMNLLYLQRERVRGCRASQWRSAIFLQSPIRHRADAGGVQCHCHRGGNFQEILSAFMSSEPLILAGRRLTRAFYLPSSPSQVEPRRCCRSQRMINEVAARWSSNPHCHAVTRPPMGECGSIWRRTSGSQLTSS